MLSKVAIGLEVGAAPKLTPVTRFPVASKRLTASVVVLSPTPEPPYVPMRKPVGRVEVPNQAVEKLAMIVASLLPVPLSSK